MFESFLRQYIRDLISCSTDLYDITEEEINDTASELVNDDSLWEMIDRYIYNYLDKYRNEE